MKASKIKSSDALIRLLAPDGYYSYLLNIEKQLSGEVDANVVKKRFRELSLTLQPDNEGDAEALEVLNRAQKVLTDPKLRKQYDILGLDLDDNGGATQGIVWKTMRKEFTHVFQLGVQTLTVACLSSIAVESRWELLPAPVLLVYVEHHLFQPTTASTKTMAMSLILAGISLAILHQCFTRGCFWLHWFGESLVIMMFTANSLDKTMQKTHPEALYDFGAFVVALCVIWLRSRFWIYMFVMGLELLFLLFMASGSPVVEMLLLETIVNDLLDQVGDKVRIHDKNLEVVHSRRSRSPTTTVPKVAKAPTDALIGLLAPDGYYSYLLNIEKPFSGEVDTKRVDKRFRKLSLKYHPDKGGDAESFRALSRAKEVLSNSNLREQYDHTLGLDLHDEQTSLIVQETVLIGLLAPDGYYRYLNIVKPVCGKIDANAVQRNYWRLEAKLHPEENKETLQGLKRARKVLSNSTLRKQYDTLGLDSGDAPGEQILHVAGVRQKVVRDTTNMVLTCVQNQMGTTLVMMMLSLVAVQYRWMLLPVLAVLVYLTTASTAAGAPLLAFAAGTGLVILYQSFPIRGFWQYWLAESLVMTGLSLISLGGTKQTPPLLLGGIGTFVALVSMWLRGSFWRYMILLGLEYLLGFFIEMTRPVIEKLPEIILNDKLMSVGSKVRAYHKHLEVYNSAKHQ